jgi:hypothetical protein
MRCMNAARPASLPVAFTRRLIGRQPGRERPVPAAETGEFVARFPELTLRSEPAHEEAFVPL